MRVAECSFARSLRAAILVDRLSESTGRIFRGAEIREAVAGVNLNTGDLNVEELAAAARREPLLSMDG